MTKIKQILLQTPGFILGVAFLLFGFAKIADLPGFHNELIHIKFLPYFIKGLCILFIPGLQITLGFILIFNNSLKKSAGLIAFIFFLTAFSFGIYFALNPAKGCGGCGQLEKTVFDWQLWKPVGIYLVSLIVCVCAMFIQNSHSVEIPHQE